MGKETNNQLKAGIIHQLLYSEIFEHPLTPVELLRFSSVKTAVTPSDFNSILEDLMADKLIHSSGEYFAVFQTGSKIEHRIEGAKRADKLFGKAVKVATFIQKFPFVEGVGISGSLSKGILHDDGDFDFFVITKPNRVWVARTLLILYKKVFLLNSRKYFCLNYFIDSDHLEIEEKNRFTAVEISTLIPATGKVFEQFYYENNWVSDYFPGGSKTEFQTRIIRKPFLSRLIEKILSGRFGDFVDSKSMKVTFKRWKRKFGDFNSDKFDLTMKTRRYLSKHHPNDFQNKVLKRYESLKEEYRQSYSEMLEKHQITL